jgi:uncharacterized spore protein YtfJ
MDMNEIMTTARKAMTVRRVFGDPYEKDGVTVIPAAIVAGGGGGGGGQSGAGESGAGESGEDGGFGVFARPAGAFSIRHGRVRWHPAISVNLVIAAAAAVAVAYLVTRSRRRS